MNKRTLLGFVGATVLAMSLASGAQAQQLLRVSGGLAGTYPQERQGRLRFAADNAAVFDAFLNLVPSPSYWELAAPTVKLVMVFGTLAAFGGVVLWAILNGQVAVTGFVVHLILFSAPFMAIRLFLK